MKVNILKDTILIFCTSSCIVVVLICVLFSSSLAYQFKERGVVRGGTSFMRIDSLLSMNEFSVALYDVDSLISCKEKGLPHFPYFDRFLSDREKYKAAVERAEIYELKWKRILCFRGMNDVDALREALENYVHLIGYNQEAAKNMLIQIEGK